MKVKSDVNERGTVHNFNDIATVKLNWEGMLILLEEFGTEFLDVCNPGWQDGTISMELHTVVNVFGPRMIMGPPPPLEMVFQLRKAL